MRKVGVRGQLNESCNYSFNDSYLPRRLSYRTGQDTANCDTCRNSACIIYRLVAIPLQRHADVNVARPSFPPGKVSRKLKDVREAEGWKTNVDAVNEHTGTCDIYTPGFLRLTSSHPVIRSGLCSTCSISFRDKRPRGEDRDDAFFRLSQLRGC